jgi:uncharacterized membrane protein YgcG
MKRSLVWTAVGAAVIGLGVPAYAASQSGNSTPTINTVKTTVQDLSGNCDEAEHANDPACTTTSAGVATTKASEPSTSLEDSAVISVDNSVDNSVDDNATDNSVDDNATDNSVDDDATENSVEDVSGNCDEAEHANDPSCTGAAAPANSVDDNSSSSSGSGSGGGDDSGHHGGGDSGNSGRGSGSDG